ncbi:Similar to crq: Protein croquemort (Drosophila melanogaster) [Cotesia congregata]|uniref:Similar to crq: Protein croquemort (Drosophila melanogaster) n=1 Tax=Cotesia congregata TaxID=51543 RepID=A0A8J2MUD9_COTCN|nr:Similar to crq: Protein croquemort (Drosophila melanogaster) [Cotesia congregata]
MSDNNNENKSNQETVQNRSQPEKMAPSKMKLGIIFGVALVSICAGITVGVLWDSIINKIIVKELPLTPTSQKYAMWEETPIPMYLEVYLFNWTNPQDFSLSSKVKPHFNELGPYVFSEVDYKVNQVWNDNETITFQQKRVWHFIASKSNGSLSDKITNINPVAASIGYKLRFKGLFALLAVNSVLKILNESRTVTKTVGELLFDGYDDELLELVHKFNRNNSETYDGTFNMLTGATGLWGTGILQEWNYSDKSKNFEKECGFINGTLGDAWPTVTENSSVNIFAPDVCTLLNLNFSKEEDHEGLIGKKYISTSTMLDNGTKVPSRACYCQGVECQPSGTLNVSSCKFGAPAFISLPHFYLADPSYLDAVDGLSPSKNKHEFSMLVEPNFGVPLRVSARLQLNLLIQPIKHLSLYTNIPRIYMPILWFKQEANLTANYARQVKFIATLPLLGHVTLYGIACIGILLMFVGIGVYLKKFRNSDDNQRLIPKTDVNSSTINS